MGQVFQPYQPKPRYIPKITKHEETIQKQVCKYLRLQYPHAIFRSDTASGMKLTKYQAITHASMQSGRGWPDLVIYEKSASGKYIGLAIELKADGETVYLKNGPRKGLLTTDKHIQEQALTLQELRKRGFYANFAVGYDQAVAMIDAYFGRATLENAELF